MSREGLSEAVQSGRSPAGNRRWPRALGVALAAVLLLAIGVGAGAYHRQALGLLGVATVSDGTADDGGAKEGIRQADAVARETTRETTPFARHANEAGVTTCASMFAALGDMLTAGSRYGVQSFWNRQAPDAHAMQALVGMSYETEGYSGPAAGYVFAAPDGATCEGSMVRIAPYPVSCEDVLSILPEDSERINALREVAVFSLSDGGQALLLPMDASCVVISVASGTQSSADQEGVRQ